MNLGRQFKIYVPTLTSSVLHCMFSSFLKHRVTVFRNTAFSFWEVFSGTISRSGINYMCVHSVKSHACTCDFCTFLYICQAWLKDKKWCENGIIRSKGVNTFITLALGKNASLFFISMDLVKKRLGFGFFFFRVFKALLLDSNAGNVSDNNTEGTNQRLFDTFHKLSLCSTIQPCNLQNTGSKLGVCR